MNSLKLVMDVCEPAENCTFNLPVIKSAFAVNSFLVNSSPSSILLFV